MCDGRKDAALEAAVHATSLAPTNAKVCPPPCREPRFALPHGEISMLRFSQRQFVPSRMQLCLYYS